MCRRTVQFSIRSNALLRGGQEGEEFFLTGIGFVWGGILFLRSRALHVLYACMSLYSFAWWGQRGLGGVC